MVANDNINKTYSFPSEMKEWKSVYFIGIGGIGMSALARFFQQRGIQVSGFDKTETILTKKLEAEGIKIHYEADKNKVSAETDLVVYTPAIAATNEELVFFRENGNRVEKRSEVLSSITKSSFNICVAGTHGKTTITTMIGHILRDSGFGCNAFLGGIAVNYDTNYWQSEKNVCVVEADEYDRSFLKLNPDVAVVSSMDADHLDIYGTAEAMENAFIEFTQKIKPAGMLVKRFGLKRGHELKRKNEMTYSLQNDAADVYAKNIKMSEGYYEFDIVLKDKELTNVKLNMGGMHNVENAVAAMAVADCLEIAPDKIISAVEKFRGVKRRFEYIINNEWLTFIDDYAHHPEELKALLQGARSLFRMRRCTVIFQPHLYSRTKDHATGIAEVLDMADRVILMPIYPAREMPIEGVSSQLILENMQLENKAILTREEIMQWIKNGFIKNRDKELGELLIVAGAGDIDGIVTPFKNELKTL